MMKVFISHSSVDKKFVRTLKEDLNENSIETWFDEDELNLGDTLAEKLELALENSSHFLIILSPSSVNSEWVRFELSKAIKHKKSDILKKIIPVKYRDCEVPKELHNLLYVDISKEVRIIQGEKVVFNSIIYSDFLLRLCKSIRNSERKLTKLDKVSFSKEILEESINRLESASNSYIKTSYKLLGYKNIESRLSYAKNVVSVSEKNKFKDVLDVRPVLLPPLLKGMFKDMKHGDEITFSKNYSFNEFGHFAGYRNDDLAITLDGRIRKGINIDRGARYNVEIDAKKRNINFIE